MEVLQAQLEQMVGMLSEAETKRDELQAQLTAALAGQKAAEAAAHSAKSQCAALEELMSERELLVFCGDSMGLLSGHYFPALVHRVADEGVRRALETSKNRRGNKPSPLAEARQADLDEEFCALGSSSSGSSNLQLLSA